MQQNWRDKVDAAKGELNFQDKQYQLRLETNFGDMTLDFYPDIAPKHCSNMLGLARAGFYDGLSFHRVIKGFVIQGGCPSGNGTGGPGYRVDAEFNEREHDFGVLSMARSQDPNSAGSQFFLCLDRVPYLDRQYTVFGKLAPDEASAKTLRAIGAVETGRGDVPLDRISIIKATVSEQPKA